MSDRIKTLQAILPTSYDDVREIAKEAVMAGLFRGTGDGTREVAEAQCLFAILTGLEAGLPPGQSVQGIYVKDGKCHITGALALALLWSKGFDVDQEEATAGNNWTATCTITRPGTGKKIARKFSKQDAIQAGLWKNEATPDSTWWTFGVRMLGWRAVGFATTDGASDVLKGLYIAEAMVGPERQQPQRRDDRSASQAQPLADVPDDIPEDDVNQDVDPDREFLDEMIAGQLKVPE